MIKGNDRSMKYHVPGSGGYDRTIADVWFATEELPGLPGSPRPSAESHSRHLDGARHHGGEPRRRIFSCQRIRGGMTTFRFRNSPNKP
ncbi:hypothetical protein JCM18920_272 [Cutibacterium acnes JCM 18920]|nr:hypothetical protein JCM18920_272 [Cutibacterium acnes JCM 18920]